jgi:hypothetical protein
MDYQEVYKGHQITVYSHRVGRGFRWGYQIDYGEIRECQDRPSRNEKIMLREGISAAKAEIDRSAPA